MRVFVFFSLMLLYSLPFLASLDASETRSLIILHPGEGRGFFSVMDHVFGNIYLYENPPTEEDRFEGGLTVDFEDKGLYFEQQKGSNWWSYYFLPVKVGIIGPKQLRANKMLYDLSPGFLERLLPRKYVHNLIEKHLKLKSNVKHIIQRYKERFTDYHTVGIHYRGTDKSSEAPRVPFEEVAETVDHWLEEIEGPLQDFCCD